MAAYLLWRLRDNLIPHTDPDWKAEGRWQEDSDNWILSLPREEKATLDSLVKKLNP